MAVPSRRTALVLAAALLLVAPGCGGDDRGQSSSADSSDTGAPSSEITAVLTDYEITLEPPQVAAGEVTFDVVNDGQAPHALEIEGVGEGSTLAAGESEPLVVTLKPGAYDLYCPVGDHVERGMKLQIEVVEPAGGSGGADDG